RERAAGERIVRRHRSGDDDALDGVVVEELVEIAVHAHARVALDEALAQGRIDIAERRQCAQLGEVACEVRAPVAETDDADHSLKTLGDSVPRFPVALRRSTTSSASSTSA